MTTESKAWRRSPHYWTPDIEAMFRRVDDKNVEDTRIARGGVLDNHDPGDEDRSER